MRTTDRRNGFLIVAVGAIAILWAGSARAQTVTNLYSFGGLPDGRQPSAGLVQGSDGFFYGTTLNGGASDLGTIYRISASGSYSNLYSFAGSPDGDAPFAGLVQGSDGYFYGTTPLGGASDLGTVFRLTVPLNPPANQISAIEVAGSDIVVSLPSVAGETYQLERRSAMDSGSWSNVPGAAVINSLGGGLTLTNVGGAAAAQAFYRARIRIGGIPVPAWDNAAENAYTNGWSTGSNGGYGFGPWMLTATSPSVDTNGFFIGSSTNNAGVTQPGIDTSVKSWGIYANGGNYTAAYRTFTGGGLVVGQSLLLNVDNGYIDGGQTVGFTIRNGTAASAPSDYNTVARLTFYYEGFASSNSYKVVDSVGTREVGVPFTSTGLRLKFTLTGTNTYSLQVVDNLTSVTNTISGTLAGSGALESIALYNRNAGEGSDFDAFFNSLQISGP